MKRLLLYLYPATWRRRYGDEFVALLEECYPGFRQTVDIVRGAFDARLRWRSPGESMAPGSTMAVFRERDAVRDDLHAVLAARDELGPEHEEHLVEGFLDRLSGGVNAPATRNARLSWRTARGVLVAAVIAVGAGGALLQQYGPVSPSAQAGPLPDITRLEAPVPAWVHRLPLTHFTNRRASYLFGDAIVDDYGGPHPYAFINFYLRYRDCPATMQGAFRLTIETIGYRVTGRTRDGRVLITHTGSLTNWSQTAVFKDRNMAASLVFPVPHKGLYFWKVEVPSTRGCAWRIDYNGT